MKMAAEEVVVQNYGKVLPDALIEALIETGEVAGLDARELFELHLANMRGDERELVRRMKEAAEGIVTSEKGQGFHSPHSSHITDAYEKDLVTGIAARARVSVDAWIEKHAPPAISRAYRFDRKVRIYMSRREEETDFTLGETDEDAQSLIAQGMEAIAELP